MGSSHHEMQQTLSMLLMHRLHVLGLQEGFQQAAMALHFH